MFQTLTTNTSAVTAVLVTLTNAQVSALADLLLIVKALPHPMTQGLIKTLDDSGAIDLMIRAANATPVPELEPTPESEPTPEALAVLFRWRGWLERSSWLLKAAESAE